MSKIKKKGLGKGMESLLDGYSIENLFISPKNEKDLEIGDTNNNVLELPISYIIVNKDQPRKNFNKESIENLAESIKSQGLIQPIVVEKIDEKTYSIVAGERRYRASKLIGLEKVPVYIKNVNNKNRLIVSLIENIQREDLNAIEEAKAYYKIIQDTKITQEELSEAVGKSRSAISNSIRLLNLPENMQQGIIDGNYTSGHARAWLSLKNPADRIILLEKLEKGDLSVREAENIANKLNLGQRNVARKEKKVKQNKDIELVETQDKFIKAVGNKVEIKGTLEKGTLLLKYNHIEELEEIFRKLSNGDELF